MSRPGWVPWAATLTVGGADDNEGARVTIPAEAVSQLPGGCDMLALVREKAG
jgi:hypothetical protein